MDKNCLLTFPFFKVCKINIAYWTQEHQLGKKPNNGTKVLKSFLEWTTFFQVKLSWEMHLRKLKSIYLSTEKKNTEKKQKNKTLLPRLRKTTVKKTWEAGATFENVFDVFKHFFSFLFKKIEMFFRKKKLWDVDQVSKC